MKRRRIKQKRRHTAIRVAIISVLAISITLAVFYTFFSDLAVRSQTGTSEDENTVRLLITMSGWEPNVIRANAGKPLNIVLTTLASEASHSDNIHSFVLSEMNVDVRLMAGETRTFQITPSQPGEYIFYCVTCCGGELSPSMAGRLIVT